MPEGDVVDEETSAAVTALYQQLIACLNEGDFLRAYALYTDDYLVRNLSEEAINPAGSDSGPHRRINAK